MSDAYHDAVRDYARAQSRRYYAAHAEQRRADARARYQVNRERILAHKKAWWKARNTTKGGEIT